MSKVITFSRTFPAYHPKAGLPTYFVEKLLASIGRHNFDEEREFNPRLSLDMFDPKHHTIRAGNRWKVGDWFSPRVWSGKPYNSKQIVIAPDIEIKKVWEFEIKGSYVYLNGEFKTKHMITLTEMAKNDGLSIVDFARWFKYPCHPHFIGQIICWNENINY